MNRDQVKAALVTVITDIQKKSGRPVPTIDDGTRPMLDLPGFDSLNGVEAAASLPGELERQVETIPFWSKKNGQPLRLAEIVDEICKTLPATGDDKQ